MTPSWAFLETFSARRLQQARTGRWTQIAPWLGTYARGRGAARKRVDDELSMWRDRLAPVGADPLDPMWLTFRPLRRDREEDWSDWLGHLLKTSPLDFAVDLLLGQFAQGVERVKEVEREVTVQTRDGKRRCDLVLTWASGKGTHIEVKLWDENFAKTAETAQALERARDRVRWNHLLLVPGEPPDLEFELQRFAVVSWADFAERFRRALWNGHGSPAWRAWAIPFLGCVEQQILGFASDTEAAPQALLRSVANALERGRR